MSDATDERDDQADAAGSDAGFHRLLEKLSTEHNFDFREYKRTSLARRVRARMQHVQVAFFEDYIKYLDRHPDEHVALFNTILINVTGFFRDPEAWKVLKGEVLPGLIDEAKATRTLRIWCAGCSSGEEPYTAAILIDELLGERTRDFSIKIYGTDVDEEALNAARHALYRLEDLKDMPADLLERYFSREGQAYRLRRDLRRWCIFGHHNVAQDPPLSHIDLLSCRNVLIYFTGDLQEKILARFHYSVRGGGCLFLGRSESLLARSRYFTPVQLKWRIFQRTTAPAPTVAATTLRAHPESEPENAPARHGRSGHNPGHQLHEVIETLPSAIMVIDPADTVLVWNAAAEALYEMSGGHARGRKFRDLDVSYRVGNLRARLEEVKEKHIPTRLEDVTFTRRSGDLVHVELTIIPLLEGERLSAVVVIGNEATEQARLREQMTKVAEQHATAIEELQSTNEELETTNEELQSTNEELETTVDELQAANTELAGANTELERRSTELRRLGQYYETMLGALEMAVIALDPSGTVTTWNKTAEQIWGLAREHAMGRPFWALPIGEVVGMTREALTRALSTGQVQTVSAIPVALPSGSRRAAMRLVPMKAGDGDVAGIIGILSADSA